MNIYKLPSPRENQIGGRPAEANASIFVIWKGRAVGWLGKLLNKLHIPGFVREMEFYDPLMEQHVSIRICSLFTVISIGGRDYYFYRLTGKDGGTGYQMRNECNR